LEYKLIEMMVVLLVLRTVGLMADLMVDLREYETVACSVVN
jgi:hypothetical protein